MSGGRLKSMPPVLRQSHPFGCPLRAIGSRDILDIIPRMPYTCSSVALPGVGVLCSRPQLWGCTAVFLSCSEQALQLGSASCAELYFHPLLLVPKRQKILSFHKWGMSLTCHFEELKTKHGKYSCSSHRFLEKHNSFQCSVDELTNHSLQEAKRRVQMIAQLCKPMHIQGGIDETSKQELGFGMVSLSSGSCIFLS